MTTLELKRMMRILKEVYVEVDKEVITKGIDPTSTEYELLILL